MINVNESILELSNSIGTVPPEYQKAVKGALEANRQMLEEANREEINSFLWHSVILISACLCAFFLWKIFLMKKKESSNNHRVHDQKTIVEKKPTERHADEIFPKAKPPLLDSQSHNETSQHVGKDSNETHDFSSHPHSRYMPKS